MTLDLLKRSENAGSLTQTQHDANFTAIETAVNALCSINGHIETPAVKSYILELKAPTAYTVSSLTTDCASGSCTVALRIDGVNVTNLSAVSVTITEAEINATGANTVAIGATLALVVTANGSPVCLDLWFTVKVTP